MKSISSAGLMALRRRRGGRRDGVVFRPRHRDTRTAMCVLHKSHSYCTVKQRKATRDKKQKNECTTALTHRKRAKQTASRGHETATYEHHFFRALITRVQQSRGSTIEVHPKLSEATRSIPYPKPDFSENQIGLASR